MKNEKEMKKMSVEWLEYWDQKWLDDNGESLRYNNYDLDKDSVVLDIGGFSGKFANKIYDIYGCNIHVFEPMSQASNFLVNKFFNNNKIKVYNYALEASNRTEQIAIANAGSSLASYGRFNDKSMPSETILVKDIAAVLKELKIDDVHLCKINIEGSEYPLLERCFEKDIHLRFKNIQVQFHSFADKLGKKRDAIRKKLKKTHYLTYDYPYQWENWKLEI